MRSSRRPGAWSGFVVAAVCVLAIAAFAGSAGAADDVSSPSVVEIVLPDRDALDRLVGTGVDLAHELDVRDDSIVAQVVVTEEELSALQAQGFESGQVLFTPARRVGRRSQVGSLLAMKGEQ